MSMQHINLRTSHVFPDMTAVPERLHVSFDIEVYDDCEADTDWTVSDSIKRHGIWEPVETAVMASAFAGNPGAYFFDFGAHVGWYSVLARCWNLEVVALEAAPGNVEMLQRRGDDDLTVLAAWIDEDYRCDMGASIAPLIVKMDIEGNEEHAVRGLRQGFENHYISQALIEMSPVFNNSYPMIARTLVRCGYECWVLPEKQTPPPVMDDTRRWLVEDCKCLHAMPDKARTEWIEDQHQFNAVFCIPEAKWG